MEDELYTWRYATSRVTGQAGYKFKGIRILRSKLAVVLTRMYIYVGLYFYEIRSEF